MTGDRSRCFWPALGVGWALIALGLVGMVSERDRTRPLLLARYVIGFLLVHDVAVVPLVLLAAWLVSRFVPMVARGPVRGALAMSALVVAFAWPLLWRFGERPTNDSALPLRYGRTVPVVIAIVWMVAAAAVVGRLISARRGRAGR